MKQFPIFLKLQDCPCLVVGGGEVATRKVRLLLGAGARVTVISPKICPALEEMVAPHKLIAETRRFRAEDIGNYTLIVAATDVSKLNEEISVLARQRNIPVNIVDRSDLCTFTVPSVVDRDPVTIAISTGGASPVLSRLLRARLETLVPASYGKLADLVAGFRHQVRQRFSGTGERRRFWEEVLQGPVAEMLLSGRENSAREALRQTIEESEIEPLSGEVYLVGAGPGDPDLLTFRALRLMQQADVVLYDRLVAQEILDMTRRDAERIYVGKARAVHSVPQPRINELLVNLAKQGKRVLRLKGGDPFIFGRGGEEIDRLAEENIPFQVVPGITAASGCAAYAGIPLTHRDYAQSCIFVTGHLKDHSVNLNWDTLTQPDQTVVIYMSLTGLPIICESLIQHGLPARTPAALVEQGTTVRQRVLTGTLASLPDLVDTAEVHAPTLVIVGNVVKLRAKLSWFGHDADAVTHQKP